VGLWTTTLVLALALLANSSRPAGVPISAEIRRLEARGLGALIGGLVARAGGVMVMGVPVPVIGHVAAALVNVRADRVARPGFGSFAGARVFEYTVSRAPEPPWQLAGAVLGRARRGRGQDLPRIVIGVISVIAVLRRIRRRPTVDCKRWRIEEDRGQRGHPCA